MMPSHTSDHIPQQTLQICDGVFGWDLQFLQEAITDENGPPIHLCFGYAGWGAGQLEREFLDGNWIIDPASSRQIFQRYRGRKVMALSYSGKWAGSNATLSMIPEDLSVN